MEKLGMIRWMIRIMMMLILIGSLMILVISPTSVFLLNWLPYIRDKSNSACFGTQGYYLLIYTFPVLSLASLACFYLHLGEFLNDDNPKSSGKRRGLGRPVLVKGTLGIVSWKELAILILFIALLVWSFSSYLHLSFTKFINPKYIALAKETMWEAKVELASLWLGNIGNICLVFLFFPVTRRSSMLSLFGLTSEVSIKYHIWLGHLTMLLFTAHGLGYIYVWASSHQISQMLKWSKTGASNLAGEVSLLAGMVIWLTTFRRIREKSFETFFYAHHLYVAFLIFFVFHMGISYASMMLPNVFLFLLDRCLRSFQSRRRSLLTHAHILHCGSIELNFSKSPDLRYTPTSIVFVNVPSISKIQWHPFTINSSSHSDKHHLSIVVKSEGTWSNKLFRILSSISDDPPPVISIEGPYGPVSTDFYAHEALVMVSGGSGITPFISIIRELVFSKASTPLPQKLLLICAFKHSSEIAMLDLIIPSAGYPSFSPDRRMQVEAYVTRDKHRAPENTNHTRTVRFKTGGEPVSHILGPRTWLWLGAVIASSFVLYVVLVAVTTRYYIYPIDKNSFLIYPLAASSGLNMVLMCVSIGAVITGAVFWNGKWNGTDLSALECCESVRELESYPQEGLVTDTKVHYGERPDLRRILGECKESSSVGVMVCGPNKMRQEVATICSTQPHNIHFESLSFSW